MGIRELFDVTGKVAVITGASQGIGAEMAYAMSEAGAGVAIVARNEERLHALKEEMRSSGYDPLPVVCDITDIAKIPEMMQSIHGQLGQIDILINNAGMNIAKPAEQVTEDDWDRVLDLNLKSAFFCSQAAAPYLKQEKHGKIINISSQMAFVGYYNRSAYCSSKGGITQMTKALAIEWAPYGINVNAIAPTFIETPMTQGMFEDEAFRKDVMDRIPLGRLAKAEDLAGALLYLSSRASDMVTGHTLVVDGGWTVW